MSKQLPAGMPTSLPTGGKADGLREAARLVARWKGDPDVQRLLQTDSAGARKIDEWAQRLAQCANLADTAFGGGGAEGTLEGQPPGHVQIVQELHQHGQWPIGPFSGERSICRFVRHSGAPDEGVAHGRPFWALAHDQGGTELEALIGLTAQQRHRSQAQLVRRRDLDFSWVATATAPPLSDAAQQAICNTMFELRKGARRTAEDFSADNRRRRQICGA